MKRTPEQIQEAFDSLSLEKSDKEDFKRNVFGLGNGIEDSKFGENVVKKWKSFTNNGSKLMYERRVERLLFSQVVSLNDREYRLACITTFAVAVYPIVGFFWKLYLS